MSAKFELMRFVLKYVFLKRIVVIHLPNKYNILFLGLGYNFVIMKVINNVISSSDILIGK